MPGGYHADRPALIRWTKIFTWRANGDGINPFGNTALEDCFIRTQDDSSYVNGRGMRRIVFWQDSNGSTFVMTQLGDEHINSHPLIIEDCTVVYSRSFYKLAKTPQLSLIILLSRAHWHHWSGGSLFNMRGKGEGSGGYTVTFRNIQVEDPRPTLQHFKILMEGVKPWGGDDENRKRGPGDLYGITFQNITLAAYSVMGEPEVLWGMEEALIYGLVFDNVTIGNQTVDSVKFFHHNQYVFDDLNIY